MPLHLLKLCVGVATIADLTTRIADRLARSRAGEPAEQIHTTRMVPKRAGEILAGGSLFWVIHGQVAARQLICDIRPFVDGEGIARCHLALVPQVIPVAPQPCRPFQGWRYLTEDAQPDDLNLYSGVSDMPEHLRRALRQLCLL